MTLLAGLKLLRATPEGHPELSRYRIAGDIPRAGITPIDLLDLPDNRRETRERCSQESRTYSARPRFARVYHAKAFGTLIWAGLRLSCSQWWHVRINALNHSPDTPNTSASQNPRNRRWMNIK